METSKEPEFKRKRGRPPLNKSLNGNPPKYHLKAPQQADAPKEVTTPIEQGSPEIEAKESHLTVVIPMTEELKRGFDEYGKSVMLPAIESPKEPSQNQLADLTPVDSIEFVNGKNTLKIVLSKKHNRMYRVQVYLNNTMEIRPATYTGYAPASTFWGFLKEITK
jgi:hypothetical protein